MHENDHRTMRADPGIAKNGRAARLHFGDRLTNISDLETDMVLSATRVFLDEIVDWAVLVQWFDQFDLAVRQVYEADLHALGRHIKRIGNVGSTI